MSVAESAHILSTPRTRTVAPSIARESLPLRFRVINPTPSATVVEVAGEIDLVTARRFAASLNLCLDAAVRTLVIDLTAVTFLGAAGLNVLACLDQRATDGGQHAHVITESRSTSRVLAITGLDRQLACHRTPNLDQK